MAIEERIPQMSDKELDNLLANARRLAQSGAAKQKAEAERLIPIVERAVAERKAKRAEELVETKKLRLAAASEEAGDPDEL
jgi:hypothetical protein